MVGEIIKVLSDEPEKIEKAILKGIKLIINIFIAANLYKLLIGPINALEITSYISWTQFLLSGKLFVCLLLYFISEYLIIPIIELMAIGVAKVFSPKKPKISRNDFRKLFKYLKIVEFQQDDELPIPGKNIDIVNSLFQEYAEDTENNEIANLKSTYIGSVINIYFPFFLMYFFLFDPSIKSIALNIIIVALFFVILVFYSGIHWLHTFIQINHVELLHSLSFIKTNAIIKSILESNHIFTVQGTKENNLKQATLFYLNNKEYVVAVWPPNRTFYLDEFNKQYEKVKSPNRIFLLIIKTGMISNLQELYICNFGDLIVVEYIDEADLSKRLSSIIADLKRHEK